MRLLIQRVAKGSVAIDGEVVGQTGKGLVVLVGVTHTDTVEDAEYLANKCVNLRIFTDENGNKDVFMGCINGSSVSSLKFHTISQKLMKVSLYKKEARLPLSFRTSSSRASQETSSAMKMPNAPQEKTIFPIWPQIRT